MERKSKEMMIRAAKNDGISNKLRNDKPLFLVLESEHAVLDFINEKSSDKNVIQIGNNYINCDIGGRIIDISTHTRKIILKITKFLLRNYIHLLDTIMALLYK